MIMNWYLKNVVTATLERQKKDGAIAVKFVTAYYRSLDFDDATKNESQGVYAKAREALALALTGLIKDKEITRERAMELARMVMRENAAQLYKLN